MEHTIHRNIIKTAGRKNETQDFTGELLIHMDYPSYSYGSL